jgi:hypothetical protein
LISDDGTGTLDFSDFVLVMGEKSREADIETHFKDTFRVFSKDEDGMYSNEDSYQGHFNMRQGRWKGGVGMWNNDYYKVVSY